MFSKDLTVPERWELMNGVEQESVKQIHSLLRRVKDNPEDYEDPVTLIEDLEFSLQGLWRFDRNPNFHTHWIEIKGCYCPKMDNRDIVYWGRGKIINQNCKWHGGVQHVVE